MSVIDSLVAAAPDPASALRAARLTWMIAGGGCVAIFGLLLLLSLRRSTRRWLAALGGSRASRRDVDPWSEAGRRAVTLPPGDDDDTVDLDPWNGPRGGEP